MKKKRGFALAEVLMSVALIGIITTVALPFYQSFQIKNELDIATTTVAQSMRRAQVLAQNMDGDSSWGVSIISGSVIVFKGASYATRDIAYDEAVSISQTIVPSGVGEIVFSKFSGVPSVTGVTTLTSLVNNSEARTISINSRGMVNF